MLELHSGQKRDFYHSDHSRLLIFLSFGLVTWVYLCVVRMFWWPSNSCTYRTSTPFSNKCVVKLWNVAFLLIPVFFKECSKTFCAVLVASLSQCSLGCSYESLVLVLSVQLMLYNCLNIDINQLNFIQFKISITSYNTQEMIIFMKTLRIKKSCAKFRTALKEQ